MVFWISLQAVYQRMVTWWLILIVSHRSARLLPYNHLWVVVSNIFLFSPRIPGEMIQFDEHIFQRGWFSHQLVYCWVTWIDHLLATLPFCTIDHQQKCSLENEHVTQKITYIIEQEIHLNQTSTILGSMFIFQCIPSLKLTQPLKIGHPKRKLVF